MIETKRLTIKPITMQDEPDIQAIFDHPRFYYLDAEYAGNSAYKYLSKYTKLHNDSPANGPLLICLATHLKETGKIIGNICLGHNFLLERLSHYYGAEVSGFMHPQFWGKNYSKEALQESLRYYATRYKEKRFYGTSDPQNKSSIAAMIAAGFKKVESLKDPLELKLYNGARDVYAITI